MDLYNRSMEKFRNVGSEMEEEKYVHALKSDKSPTTISENKFNHHSSLSINSNHLNDQSFHKVYDNEGESYLPTSLSIHNENGNNFHLSNSLPDFSDSHKSKFSVKENLHVLNDACNVTHGNISKNELPYQDDSDTYVKIENVDDKSAIILNAKSSSLTDACSSLKAKDALYDDDTEEEVANDATDVIRNASFIKKCNIGDEDTSSKLTSTIEKCHIENGADGVDFKSDEPFDHVSFKYIDDIKAFPDINSSSLSQTEPEHNTSNENDEEEGAENGDKDKGEDDEEGDDDGDEEDDDDDDEDDEDEDEEDDADTDSNENNEFKIAGEKINESVDFVQKSGGFGDDSNKEDNNVSKNNFFQQFNNPMNYEHNGFYGNNAFNISNTNAIGDLCNNFNVTYDQGIQQAPHGTFCEANNRVIGNMPLQCNKSEGPSKEDEVVVSKTKVKEKRKKKDGEDIDGEGEGVKKKRKKRSKGKGGDKRGGSDTKKNMFERKNIRYV